MCFQAQASAMTTQLTPNARRRSWASAQPCTPESYLPPVNAAHGTRQASGLPSPRHLPELANARRGCLCMCFQAQASAMTTQLTPNARRRSWASAPPCIPESYLAIVNAAHGTRQAGGLLSPRHLPELANARKGCRCMCFQAQASAMTTQLTPNARRASTTMHT